MGMMTPRKEETVITARGTLFSCSFGTEASRALAMKERLLLESGSLCCSIGSAGVAERSLETCRHSLCRVTRGSVLSAFPLTDPSGLITRNGRRCHQ